VPVFFLDEDVCARLADSLRDMGYTVTDTHDERREGIRDPRQLLFAAERNLTVITHNRRDFLLLHDAWLTWTHEWQVNRRHSGILVLDQLPPSDLPIAARAIHAHATNLDDASPGNTLYSWTRAAGWSNTTR